MNHAAMATTSAATPFAVMTSQSPTRREADKRTAIVNAPGLCRRCGRPARGQCSATGEDHRAIAVSLSRTAIVFPTTAARIAEELRQWSLVTCPQIDAALAREESPARRALQKLEAEDRFVLLEQCSRDAAEAIARAQEREKLFEEMQRRSQRLGGGSSTGVAAYRNGVTVVATAAIEGMCRRCARPFSSSNICPSTGEVHAHQQARLGSAQLPVLRPSNVAAAARYLRALDAAINERVTSILQPLEYAERSVIDTERCNWIAARGHEHRAIVDAFLEPFRVLLHQEAHARRMMSLVAKAELGPIRAACRREDADIVSRTCTERTRLQQLLEEYELLFGPVTSIDTVEEQQQQKNSEESRGVPIPLELGLAPPPRSPARSPRDVALNEVIAAEKHYRAVLYVDWGRESADLMSLKDRCELPLLADHRIRHNALRLNEALAACQAQESRMRRWLVQDALEELQEWSRSDMIELQGTAWRRIECDHVVQLEQAARWTIERDELITRKEDIVYAHLLFIPSDTPPLVTVTSRKLELEERRRLADERDEGLQMARRTTERMLQSREEAERGTDRWIIEQQALGALYGTFAEHYAALERLREEAFAIRDVVFHAVKGQKRA